MWTQRRISPRAVFLLLLILSAAALWMPRQWSDQLKHAVQVIVPGDDLVYRASSTAARATSKLDDKDRASRMEREALLHELGSQIAVAAQLRQENDRLRDLRQRSILPSTPILPARVVAWDIVAWRDSLLVERGSSRGVSWRDWVATRLFVAEGGESGVAEGQAVLARECLIGRVEQVSPYMSRVQLLSDVDSPRIQVQIGGLAGGKMEFVDYPCSLRGLGRGRMVIEDVPYQYVQAEAEEQPSANGKRRIRIDDLAYSAAGQLGLPMPLVIGKVSGIEKNPKKRLVYSVTVAPAVEIPEVREVFIVPVIPTSGLTHGPYGS